MDAETRALIDHLWHEVWRWGHVPGPILRRRQCLYFTCQRCQGTTSSGLFLLHQLGRPCTGGLGEQAAVLDGMPVVQRALVERM